MTMQQSRCHECEAGEYIYCLPASMEYNVGNFIKLWYTQYVSYSSRFLFTDNSCSSRN